MATAAPTVPTSTAQPSASETLLPVITSTIHREWWRAAAPAASAVRPDAPAGTSPDREQIAFGALTAFTIILLVSPQAWFPAIKSLRIALLAALVAIVA